MSAEFERQGRFPRPPVQDAARRRDVLEQKPDEAEQAAPARSASPPRRPRRTPSRPRRRSPKPRPKRLRREPAPLPEPPLARNPPGRRRRAGGRGCARAWRARRRRSPRASRTSSPSRSCPPTCWRISRTCWCAPISASRAATRIAALVGKGRYDKQIAPEEVRAILAEEVERVLDPGGQAAGDRRRQKALRHPRRRRQRLRQDHDHRQARAKFSAEGKSLMLAAGDTFRAAAIEQLRIWGGRMNVAGHRPRAGRRRGGPRL